MCRTDQALSLPTATPSPSLKGFYRLPLGGVTITALCDGHFALSANEVLREGETPVRDLLKRAHLGAVIRSHVNAFLIETGAHRVLIDAGAGDLQDDTLGNLSTQLVAAGLRPEQIDTVLVTHLHPDHIGGLTRHGEPAFPHAVVHVPREEATFWLDADNYASVDPSVRATFDQARQILAPYQARGRYRLFDPDASWEQSLTAQRLAGHTSGHTGYRLHTSEGDIVFCGDLFHVASVQLADPAVTVCYDSDPAQAKHSRTAFFRDACGAGDIVAAAHAPFPGLGCIDAGDSGYAWRPVT